MRRKLVGTTLALIVMRAAAACGGDDSTVGPGPSLDGSVDGTRPDAARDAVADRTGGDAANDAPMPPNDAGADAPVTKDAGMDAPAPVDATTSDASDAGSPMDAGADAPVAMDAGVDAPVQLDAGLDAPVDLDAGLDAPVDLDAGIDAPVSLDAGADVVDGSACASSMAILGGGADSFGATWSAGAWTVSPFSGTPTSATPALIRYAAGWLGAFDANGTLDYTAYAASWSAPAQIAAATTRGAPALATFNDTAHVVYQGSDFKYYHGTYALAAWDTASDPVGGALSQDFGPAPPTTATLANEFDVAFAGDDTFLYDRAWDVQWQSAAQIGKPTENTISPRVVALSGGSDDLMIVYPRQTDHVLMVATRDATSHMWSTPAVAFDTNTFSPNPVSMAPLANGGAYLVFQGGDGKPYVMDYQPARQNPWSAPSALFGASNPVVASPPQVAPGVCGDTVEIAYALGDGSVHVASVNAGTVTEGAVAGAPSSTYVTIATLP